MKRVVHKFGLVAAVVFALMIAGCSGAETATPTSAPAAATNTSAPASAPTSTDAPAATATATTAPTEAPTATEPPAAEPTAERETVTFTWAAGSVPPADADDVAIIMNELRTNDGIFGGQGNEQSLQVSFDPEKITPDEIAELLAELGHPVNEQ